MFIFHKNIFDLHCHLTIDLNIVQQLQRLIMDELDIPSFIYYIYIFINYIKKLIFYEIKRKK